MIAVLACKLCRSLIRLLGRGGTDFPGRVALKLCPNLLGELARNVTTVIVTGTNGKTTTSRMIEQSWQDAGISYFANKSGANLLSGVTAEFAVHSTLTGRCKYPYALIEADEAALKFISKYVDAKVIVFTNVFRDQLDRYGEVTHTLEKLRIGAKNSPNAVLCLNADDSLITSLHDDVPNPVLFYGVSTPIYAGHVAEVSDAPYCIKCKSEYEYDFVTYGHLGGYRCLHCGYARPTPDLCVSRIVTSDEEHSEVVFRDGQTEIPASINLPGGYNIYNAAAAAAAAHVVGIDAKTTVSALGQFECGFGRAEQFRLGQAQARMMLVKNPAGYNQVINLISHDVGSCKLAFLLNDRFADGTDISWIWDVDFEALAAQQGRFTRIFVSGVRADDMALRLKYAGFPAERIELVRDYEKLLGEIGADAAPAFIMPTYTAMFDLRGEIGKHTDVKAFYE